WFRRANLPGDIETSVEISDDAATNGERMLVIDRVVIGDARDTAVHIRATKFICADLFAGSCLDKWRPAQENRAVALHDDRLVTHRRSVRPATRAGTHHAGNLATTLYGHVRLMIQGAPQAT